jgi:hypothetical protein
MSYRSEPLRTSPASFSLAPVLRGGRAQHLARRPSLGLTLALLVIALVVELFIRLIAAT